MTILELDLFFMIRESTGNKAENFRSLPRFYAGIFAPVVRYVILYILHYVYVYCAFVYRGCTGQRMSTERKGLSHIWADRANKRTVRAVFRPRV